MQVVWFRTRLLAVSRTGLPAADVARLDSLHARTEREWLQASPESPLRTDPLAYRMLTDRAVLEVGTTRRVGACERTRRATQRLRAVPEILRAAAINLRAVSVDGPRLAAGVAEAIQALRTELVSATAECHEPRRRADLVEADSLAIRAFQSFGERLRSSAGDSR